MTLPEVHNLLCILHLQYQSYTGPIKKVNPYMISLIRNYHKRVMLKNRGFTLLEILITLIILTFGVIALSRAISTGLFASTDVENEDLALNIAQAKMEEIKNTNFASMADSGPTADTDFSNFNVTVDVNKRNKPMMVDVTVAWNVKGGQTSITLTTLVANY